MKTLDERLKSVTEKIEILKNKRMRKKFIIRICWAVALTILALILFIPYETNVPDVSGYADSPYYSLIQYLNGQLCEKPAYANHSEWLAAKADQLFYWLTAEIKGKDTEFEDWALNPQTGFVSRNADELLGDLTGEILNGDLTRSEEYIYRLDGSCLKVYSIAGLSTEQIADYQIYGADGLSAMMDADGVGMRLSEDQTILHIIAPCYDWLTLESYVGIINLDVSDPEHITQINQTYITGSVLSAKTEGENLLLAVQFRFDKDVDFSDESTFLPQIGKPGNMLSVAAENMILPGGLSDTCYTVICSLDGNSLEVQDSCALLSYSGIVKITDDSIYAARICWEDTCNGLQQLRYAMTELSVIYAAGDGLEWQKSMTLEGAVKSPDFLDPWEDMLRVVSVRTEIPVDNQHLCDAETATILYCINTRTWQIIASAESERHFDTETVHFIGNNVFLARDFANYSSETGKVYSACIMNTGDLSNITASDALPLAEYNDLYMEFGDLWVGIRRGIQNAEWNVVTVYQKTESGLISLRSTGWPSESRTISMDGEEAFLLDTQSQIIGICTYYVRQKQWEYILLHFDGTYLDLVFKIPISDGADHIRALLIDGYLYLFNGELTVHEVD